MRIQKDSDERVTYNIDDAMQTFDKVSLQYVLFENAFTGFIRLLRYLTLVKHQFCKTKN